MSSSDLFRLKRCPECSYDFSGLTALQCPECGFAFTAEVFDIPIYMKNSRRERRILALIYGVPALTFIYLYWRGLEGAIPWLLVIILVPAIAATVLAVRQRMLVGRRSEPDTALLFDVDEVRLWDGSQAIGSIRYPELRLVLSRFWIQGYCYHIRIDPGRPFIRKPLAEGIILLNREQAEALEREIARRKYRARRAEIAPPPFKA